MNVLGFLAEGAFDVTTSLATAKNIITWVLGLITENPLLAAVFVLTTLVPAGMIAFSRFKSAAAH